MLVVVLLVFPPTLVVTVVVVWEVYVVGYLLFIPLVLVLVVVVVGFLSGRVDFTLTSIDEVGILSLVVGLNSGFFLSGCSERLGCLTRDSLSCEGLGLVDSIFGLSTLFSSLIVGKD